MQRGISYSLQASPHFCFIFDSLFSAASLRSNLHISTNSSHSSNRNFTTPAKTRRIRFLALTVWYTSCFQFCRHLFAFARASGEAFSLPQSHFVCREGFLCVRVPQFEAKCQSPKQRALHHIFDAYGTKRIHDPAVVGLHKPTIQHSFQTCQRLPLIQFLLCCHTFDVKSVCTLY